MNMPRHAVDVDRRQLGLDERAGVALELLVDVHPVLGDPVGGDLLLKVRDLRHIDHLGLYAVGLVAQALDGGHLGGLAAHGGLHRCAADLVGLGHIGAAGQMAGTALQRRKLNSAGLAAQSDADYLGVVAGLAGSGLVAVLFTFLFGGSGPVQEISEGVCALIATLMLLWTSNWMLNKSSVEAWNNYIRNKTEAAVAGAQSKVESGQRLGLGMIASLAMLSFLAVFREGAETVIFYESIYSMSQDAHGMWVGGLAAAAVLIVIFLVLRFTSVKIPIGPFFLVTSIVMAALVVIFAGGGIHALIEGDLIEGTYLSSVPTNDWIGLYPYVETITAQVIAAIAVVVLFVVGSIKKHRMKLAAQAEQAK